MHKKKKHFTRLQKQKSYHDNKKLLTADNSIDIDNTSARYFRKMLIIIDNSDKHKLAIAKS